jgi:hypothetical protein
LSIISEIAAKDPYSVAMALGQFTVYSHTANNCSCCLFYFDMYKEHMPLWFRILLIFRALKIVNTNKPNVTLDFSCDPDFFFIFSQFAMSLVSCHLWFIISCMALFYAGKSAQPGGMLHFSSASFVSLL